MSYPNPPQNYDDPHRSNSRVHYRLYQGRGGPTVICVQDFDYLDYDGTKFLSPEAWDDEVDADAALQRYLRQRSSGLMLRALVREELKPGDVVDVIRDPELGVLIVIKYGQSFD